MVYVPNVQVLWSVPTMSLEYNSEEEGGEGEGEGEISGALIIGDEKGTVT